MRCCPNLRFGKQQPCKECPRVQATAQSRLTTFYCSLKNGKISDFTQIQKFERKSLRLPFCSEGAVLQALPRMKNCEISDFTQIFQTLKRNNTISPSFITYSLPSLRTRPFSLAALILPHAIRSSYATTSARIKPRSKSV